MHIPVLQKEVIEYLDPKSNENFIDCTIGEGGHTIAILERNKPEGRVLGIELDSELYRKLKSGMAEFSNRLVLVNDSYANLKEIVEREKFREARAQNNFVLGRAHKICAPISGILFDLGISSWHLKESGRGFSFLRDEPLDMRYDEKSKIKNQKSKILTAEEIVNSWTKEQIEKILREYGEERFAKKIAKKISEERKVKTIKTTFQLVEMIKRATPSWYHHQRINFATRTFQGLRIAVNDELNNLKIALLQALEVLKPGGRLAVISFHSLEDRIVKNFFSTFAKGYGGQERKIEILTKKPIFPSNEEIRVNPSSRSAKLRAVAKQQ